MRFEQLVGPIGEMRAISTAGGGTALTSTATFLTFPGGTEALQLQARNFSTAVVVQAALSPWLVVLKTTDSFAAASNTTDYSDAAQDGSTATDVVLSSLATSGALWVGSAQPFRGVTIDVDAANTAACTMAAVYWTGAALASLTITDGTASGGASLAVDGNVTWTVPTNWQAAPLSTVASIGNVLVPLKNTPLYWVKLSFNAALNSPATLNSMQAMARSTAYAELSAAVPELTLRIKRGFEGHAGVEVKCDAGTANVIANVMTSEMFG